ncbi:N-acetylneuraminate synthase family protein [Gelidibacter japonicus]|uniref:N-acetylneuraminate synthase family protein n=1 Tax=Gelidibacter japonicus TaxID=1962232 RepID=UPI003A91340E
MNKFYLYTETAFHHQGDFGYLKKLILESKEAGAKGIKFQVLTNVNDFVSTCHKAYKDLSSYCFSIEEWDQIFSYTKSLELDIIMMPLNIQALELLKKHSVRYIDIHSVSFNDSKLLKAIKKSNVEIILGVGGRTLDEIITQKTYFGKRLKILMVGFQSFPSKLEKIKLAKIEQLKSVFPEFEIGYADHSAFNDKYAILSNDYARLLGATFFEKHLTINEGEDRVDAASAVSPSKIAEIIERLKFIEEYIINKENSFIMEEEEIAYRNRQLVCVAMRDLKSGEILNNHEIALKMTHDPEHSFRVPSEISGKVLKRDIKMDQQFTANHF